MMEILEHFSMSSLLRPALAQATPLKNKLPARLKLVVFSLISFHIVQVSTGSSSITDKNSTISFRLWSSDWWKVINSFLNGKSSGLLFPHVGVTTLFSSEEIMVESIWSLIDCKCQVSPSATIQAAYAREHLDCGYSNSPFGVHPTCNGVKRPDTLGLAVGRKMYDALYFRLFIVYFSLIISECRKYTTTRTLLGYGAAVVSI